MPTPTGATARAPARPAWLTWLRSACATLVFCTALAGFLAVVAGETFGAMWVYSVCIGLSCQGLIELGRHGLLRWQARQGRPGRSTQWPGWMPMAVVIAAAAVLGSLAGAALADALVGGRLLDRITSNPRALRFTLTVSLAASVLGTLWFWSAGKLAAAQLRAEQAAHEAVQARLQLLQGQLEPHMLFNTLANLRVLIGTDPPRAQAMLDRLNAFLRASLQASRSGAAWTLAAEFERLGDYLALMQVRMGPRLVVRFDLPPALQATAVPPLLLQPLVENAVRHGLEPQLEGGRIDITAAVADGRLVLDVRDTGVGLGAASQAGTTRFGLEQARSRLAALHGAQAMLEIGPAGDAEGGTRARIVLPLPPAHTA